jgi:phage terminase Nu1 subunit (DNA packaging protein)
LADKEELANAQKRGELVSLERIRNFCTGIVRETIERITQVPGNIQDRVASESDPNRCGAAMREELQRVVDKIREMEELWKTQS